MNYNLAIPKEANDATFYLADLLGKKAMVRITKVNPTRTLNQNSYLHLILSAFGLHFGYTLEETKLIYKQVNKDIYFYIKGSKGVIKTTTFMRSSADLDKAEMAKSIDRFIEASKEAGYPLPPATDQNWLREVSNQIEREGYYL